MEETYVGDLKHMGTQYLVYSLLAFFIMSSKAKNASGLMGIDALRYLCRVDVWEPFLNLLKTGRWDYPEELTPREKEERESRMRKESLQLSQSTENGGGGGVMGLFRGSQRQTAASAIPGDSPMSAASGKVSCVVRRDDL